MTIRLRTTTCAVGLVIAMGACSKSQPPQFKVVTLPSGKQVKMLGIRSMTFPQGPPALMLSYQTDLKVSDKSALQKEVEEIWPEFKKDVEANNYSAAIISANEVPSVGIVNRSQGYNFIFDKQPDGSWKMQ